MLKGQCWRLNYLSKTWLASARTQQKTKCFDRPNIFSTSGCSRPHPPSAKTLFISAAPDKNGCHPKRRCRHLPLQTGCHWTDSNEECDLRLAFCRKPWPPWLSIGQSDGSCWKCESLNTHLCFSFNCFYAAAIVKKCSPKNRPFSIRLTMSKAFSTFPSRMSNLTSYPPNW